ncbi:low molecular weight protein-tyrosine-phosphatase [Erythrobacter sp. HA6-11]
MNSPSFLFVCLGNICRSPMAEGAMRAAASKHGLDLTIDSCGTAAYHVGSPPDDRAIATAESGGVDISGLRGRQLRPSDFDDFTHIFAMDHENLRNIERMMPDGANASVSLLMDTVVGRQGMAVSDPYYGGEEDFELTWADVNAAAYAITAALVSERGE